jgi:hypothetical protein
MIRQDQKTIATLGDDPVVGWALRALLQSVGGHAVWPLQEPRGAYCPRELFDGVDLLLLLPAVSGEERHTGLITAMRSTPQTSRIPVLVLSTGRNTQPIEGLAIVEWPCSTDELVHRIETALGTEAALGTLGDGTKPQAPGDEISSRELYNEDPYNEGV